MRQVSSAEDFSTMPQGVVPDDRTDEARARPAARRLLPGALAQGVWAATSSPLNIAITAVYVIFLWFAARPFLRWALWDATWTGADASACGQGGACWIFIREKLRFILFGFTPPQDQWRPALACLLLIAVALAAAAPALWRRATLAGAVVAVAAAACLLCGYPGAGGVAPERWSGLPVTLFLTIVSLACAFPIALLLALGRRSRMRGLRLASVVVIEVVRGVPFISILYMATLLLPLALPAGGGVDKFVRAQVALSIFVAAYMAEILRGGLNAVPRGQYEGAAALGLDGVKTMRLVALPQALRAVVAPMVNLALGVFHDTTLVLVIGMFDFLNTARAAATDPNWLGFHVEAYLFVGAAYLAASLAAARYSLWLERRLKRGAARA
jgi:general L-amino acid transport system permease protein